MFRSRLTRLPPAGLRRVRRAPRSSSQQRPSDAEPLTMTRPQIPLRRAFVIVALVSLAASCRAAERPQRGTWKAERDTVGDTIIVRTVSGSVWGTPATLREDLAIGVLEGREELMFGMIQEMAVDASGGIYVFDGRVPALRYFDSTGTYVRTLGGKGAGPGEYQDAALGIGIRRDGRIVLPEGLRVHAGLEAAVTFVGLGDKFQIWEPGRFEKRRFHAVGDSTYGGKSVLLNLPDNCELTSRLAMDARLYDAPVKRKSRMASAASGGV